MFKVVENNILSWSFDDRMLLVIPWGKNSVRIRETKEENFIENNWALTEEIKNQFSESKILIDEKKAVLVNGKIKVEVTEYGKLVFYNEDNKILLEEYWRVRRRKKQKNPNDELFVDENMINEYVSALKLEGRELKPVTNGDYKLTVRFESNADEKIFGMGQYQQNDLNMKNCILELAQRNSQVSIPFYVSNNGYGFLWNNPGIGKVTFAKNLTEWIAYDTKEVDFWICAEKTPREIVERYAEVTGKPPMMPEYAMGLWQSKLRYQTQEEILEVAREYKKRNIPLSVIVADYFHWPTQGDFRFDNDYWPDPAKMVEELKAMGVELMVSVWPTIDKRSENYDEMLEKGLLVRSDKGARIAMEFLGNTIFFDATNPDSRKYVWDKAKKNYYDNGIRIFWLDEAEPEYSPYDFDLYRYKIGRNVQVGNIYPKMFSKTFYDGMKECGQENIINLVRCAWAGSQKYGALVWSGDIDSSFRSLRFQYQCGLNMGLAGIPWWTTDIGGFHGGHIENEDFRECLIRWFQYATFSPVLRMHGDREPHTKPLGTSGGGLCKSGAPNEVWSYGEKAQEIMTKYIKIRENLKPYITKVMEEAHNYGIPPMRTMFFEYPDDEKAWSVEDQHMFGSEILVAPVLDAGVKEREVYLPKGAEWVLSSTGETYKGGQTIKVSTPIEYIPIFTKVGFDLDI